MPRERISMSPEEVVEFLRGERWMVLGTLDPDGSPCGDAVPSTLDGEMLYFQVPRGGRSHANLERDPRACCSSDRYPSYYEIKGVTVHGQARRVIDPAIVARVQSVIEAGGQAIGTLAAKVGHEAMLYALDLEDVFSFDFAKIQSKY